MSVQFNGASVSAADLAALQAAAPSPSRAPLGQPEVEHAQGKAHSVGPCPGPSLGLSSRFAIKLPGQLANSGPTLKILGSQPESAHGSETIDSDSYHHGVTFICLCPDFPLWKKALVRPERRGLSYHSLNVACCVWC